MRAKMFSLKKKLREFTLKKTSLKGKLDIELQISNNNKAL